jgi:hypothetical protein
MKSYKTFTRDGAFLSKADVTPPQTWTLTQVAEQSVAAPGKPAKTKLVLYFDGTPKGLILNMSNGDTLCELTGSEDPLKWPGTSVELYVDDAVIYAGKRVGGIRLRKPAGEQAF